MRLGDARAAVAVALTLGACTLGHDPPRGGAAGATGTGPEPARGGAVDATTGDPLSRRIDAAPIAFRRESARGDDAATPTDGTPPIEVAYDRASDLLVRAAAARAILGDGAAIDVLDDTFVFAAPRRDAVYQASLDLARRALDAFFHGRFARRPDRAVTVYVFAQASAVDAFRARHTGPARAPHLGFYDRVPREIVVDAARGITTLTHELVHPIVQTDFPDAPEWLNEGLAALFEMPVFPRPGEIHGATNWRHARLLAALASKAERPTVRIDTLFGTTAAQFHDGDDDLHYALARSLCQWLDERGQLWSFYAAWRDGVIDDASGETAFARVVGKAPAEANDEWVAWAKRL